MSEKIVIFGTGEIASMAKQYFDTDSDFSVVAFTADDNYVHSDSHEGLPVVAFSELKRLFPPSHYQMHVALSYAKLNRLRKEKYLQAKQSGYHLVSYISSASTISKDFVHGDNCLVLEDQTIQSGVVFGDNIMLWSGNHIGHGSIIESHAYLASHVVVSGHCHIGECSFIGVNAAIKDFTRIGESCIVGMSASIGKDMENGSVAINRSTEIYSEEDRISKSVRKSYFRI